MRPGEIKILYALSKNPKGLTFTGLKKQTGLSAPVLSDYIKQMVERGVLTKAGKVYVLTAVFTPLHQLNDKLEKRLAAYINSIPLTGIVTSQIDDLQKRYEIFAGFINFNKNLLRELVIGIIYKSIFDAIKKLKKPLDSLSKNESDSFVLEIQKNINANIQKWLVPFTQLLAMTVFLNIDLPYKANQAGLPAKTIEKWEEEISETLREGFLNAKWVKELSVLIENDYKRNAKRFSECVKNTPELEKAIKELTKRNPELTKRFETFAET